MDFDDPIKSARRARKWGRPVTDDEADALLAYIAELQLELANSGARNVMTVSEQGGELRRVQEAARELYDATRGQLPESLRERVARTLHLDPRR